MHAPNADIQQLENYGHERAPPRDLATVCLCVCKYVTTHVIFKECVYDFSKN